MSHGYVSIGKVPPSIHPDVSSFVSEGDQCYSYQLSGVLNGGGSLRSFLFYRQIEDANKFVLDLPSGFVPQFQQAYKVFVFGGKFRFKVLNEDAGLVSVVFDISANSATSAGNGKFKVFKGDWFLYSGFENVYSMPSVDGFDVARLNNVRIDLSCPDSSDSVSVAFDFHCYYVLKSLPSV